MNKIFILLGTLFISVALGSVLVMSLPGHYHLDETKLQIQTKNLDWSKSWDYPDRSLWNLVSNTFRYSLLLQLASFSIVLFFSFILCFISLRWKKIEYFIEKILLVGISAPALFWIPLLVYFFSLKWELLPLRFEPVLTGWVLPLMALTLRPICLSTQILLTEWKQAEFKSYFLVARSKGLSRTQVLYKHGLKNALIPFTTQLGNVLVQSLIGSVLVENLFSFPGMGLLFVHSLQNRDLPVVLTLTIVFTVVIIVIHGIVEIFQNLLEPRIKQVNT